MPKIIKSKKQSKVVSEKMYCRKCQENKALSNFYEATNPMLDTNGFMSICKECCGNLYNDYFTIYNNLETALDLTCRDLDVCFNQEALKQTQSHIEKRISQGKTADAVFGYYKSKLGSTGKNNSGIDSFRYKDSNVNNNISPEKKINNLDVNDSDFELTEDILRYWGKGRDDWEYEFLDDELYKIKTSFECPDYGMEMIMKEICFINLDIEKIRQESGKGDINKLIETRSKLMNDAKMKPIQATGAEANDQNTFGMFIKKLENDRPTDEPLDEWKDPDNFIKWHKIFVGHLADMVDIENDAVKEYREIIKPYTVTRNDENGDENGIS